MDNTYFRREKPPTQNCPFDIYVNQAGYKLRGEKRAVAPFEVENFSLADKKGNICYNGRGRHLFFDSLSGDDVWELDFSDFSAPGTYRVISGNYRSAEFTLSDSVYKYPLDAVCKAFYYLRCDELTEKYAGEYHHPACHNSLAYVYGQEDKMYDVSGGWHDAGDYGRYVTAGVCAAAHLLYSYILFPDVFDKQQLNIPGDKPQPDILREVQHELLWLLKMQRSDGAVWHKCTTMHHAPFVMPQEDKERLYLFAPSTSATADFAAICALAARIYKDKEFTDTLIKAAEKSLLWLNSHPEFIGFDNPPGCNTGVYGERDDKDNRFFAMAEMYLLTKEEKYLDYIKRHYNKVDLAGLGYVNMAGLSAIGLILDNSAPKEIIDACRNAFIKRAEEIRENADKSGYRTAMTEYQYCWGSSMNLLKNAMTMIISDRITGKNQYTDYIKYQADYLFGLNATGYSYVTGIGEFSINNPHLRPAFADGIDKCMPGFVSGGANRYPCDPDAEILIPKGTPPAKCFADDVGCYSLNEVTIYWNSPAVFVLAFLCDE